jgi:hypothetical protein
MWIIEQWKKFVFFPPPLSIEPEISASKESPPVFVIPQVASLESFPPVARILSILRQWNHVEPPPNVVQGIFLQGKCHQKHFYSSPGAIV